MADGRRPRLHVEDSGGTGPVVVFMHGLGGSASQPREVFPAASGFRRITPEQRAHGASGAGNAAELSIATFADDTAAIIEELRQGPVIVGGISMGAAIALRLAVTRPGLVRGLILARPAWLCDAAPPNMAPNAEVGRLLASMPAEAARAAFATSETARRLAIEGPDNLATLQGFFSRAPREVTSHLLCAIATDGPGVSRAAVTAITVPTLVIGHGLDAVHPLAFAEELARLVPHARLATITPKAEDRQRYVNDMRREIGTFLKDQFA